MSEKEGKGKVSQGRVPNRTQVAWRPSSAHPQQSIPQRKKKRHWHPRITSSFFPSIQLKLSMYLRVAPFHYLPVLLLEAESKNASSWLEKKNRMWYFPLVMT